MASELGDADRLLDLLHGNWITRAIALCAALRLVDHAKVAPQSSASLAAMTGSDADGLRRLLDALCTIGVMARGPDDRYGPTRMGLLLSEDAPGSLRAWALWWGERCWPLWERLDYSIKTGRAARPLLVTTTGWSGLGDDAAAAGVFNRAMRELSALVGAALVARLDLRGAQQVIDVGGGHGELLIAVLGAAQGAGGVIVDLEHAQPGAESRLREAGLSHRAAFVAGDFFTAVPSGGDVYLLKSILHDWPDHEAVRVLTRVREAMAPASRLLVLERALVATPADDAEHRSTARSDLHMLLAHGGQERTEAALRGLIDSAGLTSGPAHRLVMGMVAIEARLRSDSEPRQA